MQAATARARECLARTRELSTLEGDFTLISLPGFKCVAPSRPSYPGMCVTVGKKQLGLYQLYSFY